MVTLYRKTTTTTIKYGTLQFTSLDSDCQYLAVAGRTGLAHYSVLQRKWRLFGNETQEKDFIVTGGLVSK